MCLSSEILDGQGPCSVEGSQAGSLKGGGTGLSGSSARTQSCSLQCRTEDCLFLLKSETDQVMRFYRSCFLLSRRSENLLNMLATREEGEE